MAGSSRPPGSLEVRRAIDEGEIPPVWLWSGPENYLKDDLFRRLADKLVEPALASLNVNRYRAGQDDLEVVLATCLTLPMISDRRVVLLDEIEALGKGDRERLEAYVERPSPETALVLWGERGPRDSFHARLTQKKKPPAVAAVSAVFWVPFENDTRRWVQIQFRDRGKTCDTAVAQALIERCGGGQGRQVPLRDIAP
jgi:DNA polymerase III delta subunit